MDETMLELPILPGIGLAGISLGESVDDVIARHGVPTSRRDVASGVDALNYECFFVLFDNDRAVTVSAEEGYVGQTLQGAYVGMPWLELLEIHPDVYYDATLIWMSHSIDGLQFSIESPDADPDSPFDTFDEEITMRDPENAFVASISVNPRGDRRGPWQRSGRKLAK